MRGRRMGRETLVLFMCLISAVYGGKDISTIIVGAGMSGIMAARTLSENGVNDFLLLEATDRIGGRMHKKEFGGHTIELGANWVEGVGGAHTNPIWTLANKYNLRTFLSYSGNLTYNSYKEKGGLYPQPLVAKVYEMASERSDWCANLSKNLKADRIEDISVLSAQRMFGRVPESTLDMAVDYFFYDAEIAEPPRVTSLKNVEPIPTFEYFGKDTYFVADSRGYEYIVYKLARDFLKGSNGSITDPRLKFKKVVYKVDYNDDSVTVTTEDGFEYTAKNVIISVSLGVLQSKLMEFQPELPMWKQFAIYKFNMVDYCKIYLKFPHSFWPVGKGTEYFMYAHRRRGYYIFWQHLEEKYPGSNILMVTVTDEEAQRVEMQPEIDTRTEIMEVLRKMFGDDIPEIEAILVPKWRQNRFYKGTYSNWPIGATVKDFYELKAPLGPLYFTGEHTSQLFNGYVHGAYLEGISSAKMVLDCVKSNICPPNLTMIQLPPIIPPDWSDLIKNQSKSNTSGQRSRRKTQKYSAKATEKSYGN